MRMQQQCALERLGELFGRRSRSVKESNNSPPILTTSFINLDVYRDLCSGTGRRDDGDGDGDGVPSLEKRSYVKTHSSVFWAVQRYGEGEGKGEQT